MYDDKFPEEPELQLVVVEETPAPAPNVTDLFGLNEPSPEVFNRKPNRKDLN